MPNNTNTIQFNQMVQCSISASLKKVVEIKFAFISESRRKWEKEVRLNFLLLINVVCFQLPFCVRSTATQVLPSHSVYIARPFFFVLATLGSEEMLQSWCYDRDPCSLTLTGFEMLIFFSFNENELSKRATQTALPPHPFQSGEKKTP